MSTVDRKSLFDDDLLRNLPPGARSELLRHTLEGHVPPPNRQVFVNRTLRMERIRVIGFDLDWTLADYEEEALSDLAFQLARDRLVERYEYPREVLRLKFRPGFSRRGLIIDKEAGMVLKMNRHRYVGRAYHGRRFLDPNRRAELYRQEPIITTGDRFHFVDTLFEMPEVQLFTELVELRKRGHDLPEPEGLFRDAREAMDSIHADNTLKGRILGDLPRFVKREEELGLALIRLGMGGRKLLLVTNSEWYYTEGLCSYLFDGLLPGFDSWRDLFDLVVVDAAKPGFFRRRSPFAPIGPDGEPLRDEDVEVPEWGQCYSGGCREGVMDLLGCPGEQVLYVGDHIYGDIFSTKRSSTWRTALIIRELEDELTARRSLASQVRHADVLRAEIADLGRRMDDLADVLALSRELLPEDEGVPAGMKRTERSLKALREEHRAMRHHKNRLQQRISQAINPYWGSVFRQGSNKSLFGSQVDDFACIYTSRVSNFAYYGCNHYYRVLRDEMMHDLEV